MAYMWAHPGKNLLFMGAELGDDREWSEERGLDWYLLHDPQRAGLKRLLTDLNAAYRANAALWSQDTSPAGFRWILNDDVTHNTIAFLRLAPDGSALACIANFSGGPLDDYRIGLPSAGRWTEVVNTDATSMAAPASATWAASTPTTSPGTASPSPRSSACRRWACSGSNPHKNHNHQGYARSARIP